MACSKNVDGAPTIAMAHNPVLPKPDPTMTIARQYRRDPDTALEIRRTRLEAGGFSPHSHEELMLGLIRTGRKAFRRDRAPHLADPGSVSLVNPGEWHDGARDAGEVLIYDAIYLPFDRNIRFRAGVVEDPIVFAAWDTVRRLTLDNAPRLEKDVAIERACLLLERRHGDRTRTPPRPLPPRLVQRIVARIRAEFDQPLPIQTLADEIDVSAEHLMRSFSKSVGAPIHVFQTQCRIEEAKRLLRAGAGLADTAAGVGFADQAQFTRRFRALTGLTPGVYRQAWR